MAAAYIFVLSTKIFIGSALGRRSDIRCACTERSRSTVRLDFAIELFEPQRRGDAEEDLTTEGAEFGTEGAEVSDAT